MKDSESSSEGKVELELWDSFEACSCRAVLFFRDELAACINRCCSTLSEQMSSVGQTKALASDR